MTSLHRCRDCLLLHRRPIDPVGHNSDFYQDDYEQGETTELPSNEKLDQMISCRFRGTDHDMHGKIELLRKLGVADGCHVLDFGASWGYGTWQFQHQGFNVEGFEIGRSRAKFANSKLGQDVRFNPDELSGDYDVVFSNHVMEHVPKPSETFAELMALLRPGGLFVAFTPNGSTQRMQVDESYRRNWGMVHPQLLDDEFCLHLAAGRSSIIASNDYVTLKESPNPWSDKIDDPLTGIELLFCVRKQ